MEVSKSTGTPRYYEAFQSTDGGMTLRILRTPDNNSINPVLMELDSLLKNRKPPVLTVDLNGINDLDDMGALLLIELKRKAALNGGVFELKNQNDRVNEAISSFKLDRLGIQPAQAKRVPENIFVRMGEISLAPLYETKNLVDFAGAVTLSLFHVIMHPRSLRWDDTFSYMQKTGVEALPIVGLISFLLGLIMAFMSSVQLQQFGANIYVASLVSLAMTRELGPIMTTIIVAGRSASAFAAEIGSMKISEEVDALVTMGFDPIRFLAAPKIIASVFVVPFLTLFSDLFAILGGLLVGVTILDLTANAYMTQTIKTLSLFDVFWGVSKSGVFALLISGIGCFMGFRVRGGAESVGKATTSAVVSSIFLIILFDSIFSVILRYWG